MKLLKITAAFATISMLGGCASIVGDKEQAVTINSTPSNAHLLITDERSMEVHEGTTPATVTLKKSSGYFSGKTYTVEISKDGYESHAVKINSSVNGWYVGGNILFGGLIGWLIVDPMTGAMYNLTPDTINNTLVESVATNSNNESEITIVMIKDVPNEMLKDIKYLGKI